VPFPDPGAPKIRYPEAFMEAGEGEGEGEEIGAAVLSS